MKRKQSIEQVRWDLALRYRLIETVAWWEGRLTTGHLIQSFGISRQQASKDINTYINEHAPRNLTYDKQRKGYVPSKQFKPLFIDDSASAYLHLLYQNNERAPHIDDWPWPTPIPRCSKCQTGRFGLKFCGPCSQLVETVCA